MTSTRQSIHPRRLRRDALSSICPWSGAFAGSTTLGFAVEIWDWRRHDLDRLARLHRDGRGLHLDDRLHRGHPRRRAGADELLATAAQSIPVARRIGAGRSTCTAPDSTIERPAGRPRSRRGAGAGAAMWAQAHGNPHRVADLGANARGWSPSCWRTSTSPSTTRRHRSRAAADTLALVSAVDSPHLRLNLDLYHAQIGEGNLIDLCRRAPALDRRDPGRRRPRPVRAGHRRDQLCGRGPCPGRHGVCRRGRPGVLRLRRPRRGARCLRLTRY
jgi:sugar phosphate isomerase/epimerase